MDTIKQVLMRRDGKSSSEADAAIREAKKRLQELLAEGNLVEAEDVCGEYFGLEPDYLIDLL